MHDDLEPANKFSLRIKTLVGANAALLFIVGVAFDPELYVTVVALATLPVTIAYPLLYTRLPWKKTLLGRALMTKARAVALLYIFGLLPLVWIYPYQNYVWAFVTTYLSVGIYFQFIVLLRIWRRAQLRRQATEEPGDSHDYSSLSQEEMKP